MNGEYDQEPIDDAIITDYDRYRLVTSESMKVLLTQDFGISITEFKQYAEKLSGNRLCRHIDNLHDNISRLREKLHDSLKALSRQNFVHTNLLINIGNWVYV